MSRRLWAGMIVAVLAAVVAASATAVGNARTTAPGVQQRSLQCPFTRNLLPGWQASFGRASSVAAANALQARAARIGFAHLLVQQYCGGGYEVVLRGICPFGVAYNLQVEGRRAGFTVLLDYKKPMDISPDLVAVFGHFRTRAAAEAFKPRVDREFKHVSIIQDGGCGNDWEVAVTGVTSPRQGADFAQQARSLGFEVSIESN